jgi:hypothetical protein
MLHYPKPYFAFGIDLLNTPKEDTWAVNYLNGIYQYVKNGHVLQFDGQKSVGLYALSDSLMKQNLLGKTKAAADSSLLTPFPSCARQPVAFHSSLPKMERELKAIIQQYMERMTEDRLLP